MIKNNEKFSILSNVQTHYLFKLDSQKVVQHTGSKLLIHGTKHHKESQLQYLRCRMAIS